MLVNALALMLIAQAEPLCDDEEECRTECSAGNLAQCQALADTIVPDEPLEAIRLYEKACSKGLFHSCAKLAFHLVERDPANRQVHARALKLTEQACNANDALGCANLGAWLWDDGPAFFARAAVAAEKGCRLKDAYACGTLGTMYKDGIGVEKDPRKALSLMSEACEADSPWICTVLGVALIEGSVGKVDLKRAARLFTKACNDDEYATACFQLSGANRRGLGVRRDRHKAQELLQRACDLGMAEACPGEDDSDTKTDEAP